MSPEDLLEMLEQCEAVLKVRRAAAQAFVANPNSKAASRVLERANLALGIHAETHFNALVSALRERLGAQVYEEAAPPVQYSTEGSLDREHLAERLLFMLRIYPNYRVDSRGPAGIIVRLLDDIKPEIAEAFRENDSTGEVYERFFGDDDVEKARRETAEVMQAVEEGRVESTIELEFREKILDYDGEGPCPYCELLNLRLRDHGVGCERSTGDPSEHFPKCPYDRIVGPNLKLSRAMVIVELAIEWVALFDEAHLTELYRQLLAQAFINEQGERL